MNRMRTIALSAFAVVGIAFHVSAWGGEGHQIIALIAEEHLTPEAQAGIRELLGEEVFISDAEIASWADEVKRERGRPSTSSWHFVNIPIASGGYDAERDSPHTTDIIEATASQIAAITDKNLPLERRAEALKFVVHLIGDLHQPLHCADRNGDRGGNALLCWFLSGEGRPTNLHAVWDTAILKHLKAGERVVPYARRLNENVTSEEFQTWCAGSLIEWANEGQRLAREYVYEGVAVPTEGVSPPVLDQAYVQRAAPVIEGQLTKGGLRLAAVLNKAFAKP